jgi:hypothetical protein
MEKKFKELLTEEFFKNNPYNIKNYILKLKSPNKNTGGFFLFG